MMAPLGESNVETNMPMSTSPSSAEEREKQISLALNHIKYLLKRRGCDPKAYNPKYLRDKAEAVVDQWMSENPGVPGPYRPLTDGDSGNE